MAQTETRLPQIIQGGMGAGVSDWHLARTVSLRGQIGVVSGTALDLILARRLQLGDPGGHMRRALDAFPDREIANRIIANYFKPEGIPPEKPYANKPMVGHNPGRPLCELLVAAGFVEVYLAKEGHGGLVGINCLHKIQTPLLACLYGAILADVDVVIVGAGIPLDIPAILEALSASQPATLKLHVHDSKRGQEHVMKFDPASVLSTPPPSLSRPLFFPIVSSATLASLLAKRCAGRIDGFIVETPTAGGHNAPPRGNSELSDMGEPVYGPRDAIDLAAIKSHGIPFWLAGSCGTPEALVSAREAGAEGIQVGSLFAFCEDSGLREDLKRDIVSQCVRGDVPQVFTDPQASPTGFPFKVLANPGTLSDDAIYAERERTCDLGYLREAWERPDGTLGWRCPAEDSADYVRKGGQSEDTAGRKCLCNALTANIGLEQIRHDNRRELPLMTSGDDLSSIPRILDNGQTSYTSAQVIDFLLAAKQA